MATQKGLGKGLGALIAMFDEEGNGDDESAKDFFDLGTASERTKNDEKSKNNVGEISIDLIDNNPNQPRKYFDLGQLTELSQSIKEHGVIQPIVLNKVGQRFMIIAGERRWRAAKMAGLKSMPAIVREFSRKQIAEISIVENLQRTDLNEIELARGIKSLIDEFGLTQDQASEILGKPRSSIANTLRLLGLPEAVQEMVESRQLSAGHGKVLAILSSEDECRKFAQKTILEHLSVRQLEDLIKEHVSGKPSSSSSNKDPELKKLEKELSSALGMKLSIVGTKDKGKITIEYFSRTDLEKLLDRLGR